MTVKSPMRPIAMSDKQLLNEIPQSNEHQQGEAQNDLFLRICKDVSNVVAGCSRESDVFLGGTARGMAAAFEMDVKDGTIYEKAGMAGVVGTAFGILGRVSPRCALAAGGVMSIPATWSAWSQLNTFNPKNVERYHKIGSMMSESWSGSSNVEHNKDDAARFFGRGAYEIGLNTACGIVGGAAGWSAAPRIAVGSRCWQLAKPIEELRPGVWARQYQTLGGARVTEYVDGPKFTVHRDGTRVWDGNNGAREVIRPDGSRSIAEVKVVADDGTRITHLPNGGRVERQFDGTEIHDSPIMGRTMTFFPNLDRLAQYKNEVRIIDRPDGMRMTIHPEGKTYAEYTEPKRFFIGDDNKLRCESSNVPLRDYMVGWSEVRPSAPRKTVHPDGTTHQISDTASISCFPDGSSITRKLGGRQTTVDVDGTVIEEMYFRNKFFNPLLGSANREVQMMPLPQKATLTTQPDGIKIFVKPGLTHIQYPNGNSKMIYPNRVVSHIGGRKFVEDRQGRVSSPNEFSTAPWS